MKQPLKRGGPVAVLATVAACAVPFVATADASQKRTDKKQNAAIAKVVKGVTAVSGRTTKLSKRVDGIDTRLKAIETAAPQIVTGLGQLKTGLETAGAGLTKLKTFLGATEYGFGQVTVLSAGPTPHPQGGSFVVTPNIPDDVQQAQTTQQFIAQDTGTVLVSYGVRSGESDGTGASDPAALCRVSVTNKTGDIGQTAPNGALSGLPFQPVNTKSPLTSTDGANQGFPFGLKTSGADADVTQNLSTTVAVTAGDSYTVGMSCVDTTPNADDPSA
jgi:uncharacterized phage infection (PIP) family protein YhgE